MNSLRRGNRRLGHGLRERIERPHAANAAKPHHHGALLSMAWAALAGGAGVMAIEASDGSNARLRVLVRRYGSKPDASAMDSDTHDPTLDSELIDAKPVRLSAASETLDPSDLPRHPKPLLREPVAAIVKQTLLSDAAWCSLGVLPPSSLGPASPGFV